MRLGCRPLGRHRGPLGGTQRLRLRAHRLLTAEQTTRMGGGSFAIAGGAPGLNAAVEAGDDTVVIVLTNLDPPSAEQVATAIARQLAR